MTASIWGTMKLKVMKGIIYHSLQEGYHNFFLSQVNLTIYMSCFRPPQTWRNRISKVL